MEGDGGAASEAPVTTDSEQQENVTQVGATIPTITSTISGLPISPAYAGYGFSTNVFSSRRGHFNRGYANAKPRLPKVSYESNYVPSRRGSQAVVHAERELIGDGERHVDPMDNFKPQKFKEGSTRTDDKPEQVDKEYRNTGRKAYKEENKGNSEGSARRQTRYAS